MISAPLDPTKIITLGRDDPVWWVRNVIAWNPWSFQRDILQSLVENRYTVVGTSHGLGKTTTAAGAALWFGALRPASITVTTATTQRQVKMNLWRELHAHYGRSKVPLGGRPSTTEIKFPMRGADGTVSWDEWIIQGFTAKEGDATRYAGIHAPSVFVIIDEAAGVHESVFEGIASAMAGGHARCLMIGNPTAATGTFASRIKRGGPGVLSCDAFGSPNFRKWGITIDDIRSGDWKAKVKGPHPFPSLITPEWVAEQHQAWCDGRQENEDDPRWLGRVMARLPGSDHNSVISLAVVEAAVHAWREIEDGDDGKKWGDQIILSYDVARLGLDSTSCAVTCIGQGVRELIRRPRETLDRFEDAVRAQVAFERSYGRVIREVRIDADGLGSGPADNLTRWARDKDRPPSGHPKIKVVRVRSGFKASKPEDYKNARAEMWFTALEALKGGYALPPDPELERQIIAPRWRLYGEKNVKAIEPKDEIKTRIGRSPDDAEAVIYSISKPPVEKKSIDLDPGFFHRANQWIDD